ncbi:hypothetical protein RHGRI_019877 [Rhododendron griersonianum]|uniref:Uncharacterized protein n=1 Tax=Rhododendron griersonianum TaxID=479676 RepID=A0AAV6JE93_9ERIC|nr:hypothetical protein RHGRI_019877 [Rhododendron griersonianum]
MSYSAEMLETVKYLIGSIGPSGYGSKSTAEQVTECCPDLSSLTAIITGATSGIGAETARVLAKRGARLILPARSLKAAEDAKARIVSEFPDTEIFLMALDLSHFLLTKLLLKKMTETARATGVQGRIVNVSSSIHGWFSGDEMEANVTVNCVHPGIVRTRLTRDREGFITDLVFFLASKLLKRIPQAAATSCYVATHPRLANVSGKYFADCNEASTSKLGSNSFEAARLWSASELMVSRYSEAVFD